MHVEKVRFDEVFDAVERSGNFSFKSHGRTEYGAKLQNHVIPRAGSTYAVAFAERGNWATVMGWRDLASPDVVLTHSTWSFWFFALSDLIVYSVLFIAGALLIAGAVALAALAITVPAAWALYYQVRLNRDVKRALLAAGADAG